MSGCPSRHVSFRPPNGDELMFVGLKGENQTIYTIGVDGSNPHPVVGPTTGIQGPQWSPDGSRIAYSQFDVASNRVFTHIVGADGSGHDVLDEPAGRDLPALPGLVARRAVGPCRARLLG